MKGTQDRTDGESTLRGLLEEMRDLTRAEGCEGFGFEHGHDASTERNRTRTTAEHQGAETGAP